MVEQVMGGTTGPTDGGALFKVMRLDFINISSVLMRGPRDWFDKFNEQVKTSPF